MNFLYVFIALVFLTTYNYAYVFDKRSCDNMLPSLHLLTTSDHSGEQQPKKEEEEKEETTKDSIEVEKSSENDEKSSERKEEIDISLSLDPSPYKITVDAIKYRRNRPLSVKIEGGDLNGVLIQARQYVSQPSSPSLMGTFVNLPPGIRTLDCDRGPSFSVANTAYSRDASVKKGLELKWKAPSEDVGSIVFVATLIKDETYWSFVSSQPLLFNDFPPALTGCGKDRSCFRYSQVHENCDDGKCNYLVVSKVENDYVVFTIGGKIQGDRGYVGIGFTMDKQKLSFIDMCVCMKTGPNQVDAAHYMVTERSSSPVKQHEELEDEETDVDNDHIWCRFRRPLRIPGTQLADLTQSLFQVFLWGDLNPSTGAPVLPKEDEIVTVIETWNHTETMNIVHLVGGADVVRFSWCILIAVLVATLVELY